MKDKRYTPSKYERALKHVKELKQFYKHVLIYVIANLLLLFGRAELSDFVIYSSKDYDKGFFDWVTINTVLIAVLWGVALLIHGIYVYRHKFSFFENWENKKIQEFMDEDPNKTAENQHWE